jgi:hypothetical protein
MAQRKQADRIFMQWRPRGERPDLPHIARQLGHDVAVPRGTASMRNLSQRPTEASGRPVTPDRRKVGLEVSSIDSVTLSDGESRENAHTPADLARFPCVWRGLTQGPYPGDLHADFLAAVAKSAVSPASAKLLRHRWRLP